MMRALPEALSLGVASSSYQIEGAWNVADKSPSIWDKYCEIPGVIVDDTTGRDACKSYEYYKRDIAMLNFLGVIFYRFSISWPRVLPTGYPNKISEEGAAYYSNLIDGLLANGIEPVVTLYHWDLPQSLQDLGGWTNPLVTEWFKDYARVLFDLYGDRVKKWITLNEPRQVCVSGYGGTEYAPGIDSGGTGEYMCAKNAVIAHAKAWHLYDEEYRDKQNGTIGITIACEYNEALTNDTDDIQAAADAMDFEIGIYSHPIFSGKGGFPERVVKLVGEKSMQQGYSMSRLPEFTKEETEFVKGSSDFFGFNHYSTNYYTRKTFKKGMYPIPSSDDDLGAFYTSGHYKSNDSSVSTVTPHGMYMSLKWVKDNCNDPPIMITENGFGNDGGLDDQDRVLYLYSYINAVLDTIEKEDCNVLCYTMWSVMDNYEWNKGYSVKYGLFEVDFEDDQRTRRAKSSAFWYRDLITTRTLKSNFTPVFEDLSF